jgi:hypothetical protein
VLRRYPLLIWGDSSHQIAKPPNVDGADLPDENADSLAQQLYLWAEDAGLALSEIGATRTTERGSNSSAERSLCAAAALLVTHSPRGAEHTRGSLPAAFGHAHRARQCDELRSGLPAGAVAGLGQITLVGWPLG